MSPEMLLPKKSRGVTLLAITDSRRRASSRATIVKAYNTVRGSAFKHVKAALPALGALVQKYMMLRTVIRDACAT